MVDCHRQWLEAYAAAQHADGTRPHPGKQVSIQGSRVRESEHGWREGRACAARETNLALALCTRLAFKVTHSAVCV